MAICGVYGIKEKMGISNEIANQNESLPLKKYTTYSLTITTGIFILKIHWQQNEYLVDFEILSYDTRGLGDERKRRKIFNYIKKNTSGKAVVFLQETHSTKKHENLWKYQ